MPLLDRLEKDAVATYGDISPGDVSIRLHAGRRWAYLKVDATISGLLVEHAAKTPLSAARLA